MAIFDRFKGRPRQEEAAQQPETAREEKAARIDDSAENPGKQRAGWMSRFKKGLSKTRQNLGGKLGNLIHRSGKLDEDFWDELEEILIQADVGVKTALELVEKVQHEVRKQKIQEPSLVMGIIRTEVEKLLSSSSGELCDDQTPPMVILVVGVNGSGKTTSIAKLAHHFKAQGKRVLLAAGDTFRAAAIDQLQIWADRIGVEVVKHQEGADPGAVVFDALNAAQARRADVLIIDTAGRLQNKTNLMKEIGKVRKIIERELPGAPHEVLLVLDATTGQNAISQARTFAEATGVSGIILTKLDGTAKGGIVLAIARELDIPVKYVGVGEGMEDLQPFVPAVFAAALFGEGSDDNEAE